MYKFPLEPLLNHRRLVEEGLQRELAELETKRQAVCSQLEAVAVAMQHCGMPADRNGAAGMDVGLLQLRTRYLHRLQQERDALRRRLVAAEKAVAAKRNELIEMVKSRKTIEKLKEKGLHEYQTDASRKEQASLSEMAVLRYRR